jgi:phospho-N-acetylmuramoyl-pentapeptide-transferase
MLYLLAQQLDFPGLLNLVRYLSFRAGAASATALLIGLVLGPWLISYLRVRQRRGQPIRADGPQSHFAKRGTPTMGGLLILVAFTASVVLWMNVESIYVWATLLVIAGLRADRVPRRLCEGQEGASRRLVGQDPAGAGVRDRRGSRPG